MASRVSSKENKPLENFRYYNNRGQQQLFAINGEYYLVYWCMINNH